MRWTERRFESLTSLSTILHIRHAKCRVGTRVNAYKQGPCMYVNLTGSML